MSSRYRLYSLLISTSTMHVCSLSKNDKTYKSNENTFNENKFNSFKTRKNKKKKFENVHPFAKFIKKQNFKNPKNQW